MQDDVARIRTSWAAAIAAREIVGEIFYKNLFTLAPETRVLFPEKLDVQGRKLVQTLSWILDHLEDPEELHPAAEDLARRHVNYGVISGHYDAVGAALIATLQDSLGDAFGEKDVAAWTAVYADLSRLMINAAYPAQV